MRSGRDLPGRQENDPPWFSTENQLGTLGDIEVLFVQDAWPAGEDSIWAMTCLKVAVRITHLKSRRRKRQKLSFPARWESCYQYDVSHHDVGGVTDGRFHVEVRARIGLSVERLPAPSVPAVLGEALSDVTSGGQVISKPEKNQSNSYRGILQWTSRTHTITASSIYHPDRALKRKITPKEMCRIFDYPTNRTGIMTDQQIKILTSTDKPGKVVQDAIYFLSTPGQGKDASVIADDILPTSRGGSVAGALGDDIKTDKKRKDVSEARNDRPLKQGNLSEFPQNSGRGVEKRESYDNRVLKELPGFKESALAGPNLENLDSSNRTSENPGPSNDKGGTKLNPIGGLDIEVSSVSPHTGEDDHIQTVSMREHFRDKLREDEPKNEKAL